MSCPGKSVSLQHDKKRISIKTAIPRRCDSFTTPGFFIMATKPTIKRVKVAELKFDDHNANAGTPDGAALLRNSIERLGFGRSVLVDKNDKLIAGNKTTEQAIETGAEEAIVIETDGKQLIVVKRTDLDLSDDTDGRGRALALADNRVSEANLKWNPDEMNLHFDAAMNVGIPDIIFHVPDMNIPGGGPGGGDEPKDLSGRIEHLYKIEIEFADETEQAEAFESLTAAGYNCKILTL